MDRILIVLHCILIVTSLDRSNIIYWTIGELPSSCIFGSNVTLFCNTSAVGLQKTTWMKESDVILHKGFSFYPDKYTGKEVTTGSSLFIMNATESDFNVSYTCLSDVYSYKDVLVINSSSFVCLPQKTNSSWIINGRNISVHLNLDRFFPVPNCKTMFDEDVLITNQGVSVYQENMYFHGTINITSHSHVDICGGYLTVVCMFGYSYSDVIATESLQNCSVKDISGHGTAFTFLGTVFGVVVSFVILCIVCFLFLYVERSHHSMNKRDEQARGTLEESVPLNEMLTNEKIDKQGTENGSDLEQKKRHGTETFNLNCLTDCFNLEHKNQGHRQTS